LRIVSLLPGATEIVCALGLDDQLVGVSHECDYPPDVVTGKPVLTASAVGGAHPDGMPLSSREIDERVRALVAAGESLHTLDTDLLRELKPDLLLTQALCDVCAPSHKMAVAAVEAVSPSTQVLSLEPSTLEDVLQSIRQVGAATDRGAEAEALVARMRERLDQVRERAASVPERPRALLLEWADPPFCAGHWNPELLALAGGAGARWDEPGKPSRTLTWDEIRGWAPDMLALLPCGFDANRAIDEAYALPDVPGWFDLPAVRAGECYAVDGSAYFNRPGPRLVESAEILATILHPETFTELLPPYSVRRFPGDLLEPQKSDAAR
jgi:iron complex transport system substrate-binding protein